MKYVKTCKSIRIDSETLTKLKDMDFILQTLALELEGIAGEDDDYKPLADDAWHASASLSDFLDAYKREVSPLD
jgi:hypothetical protein